MFSENIFPRYFFLLSKRSAPFRSMSFKADFPLNAFWIRAMYYLLLNQLPGITSMLWPMNVWNHTAGANPCLTDESWPHWNGNVVIWMEFPLQAAAQVIKMTTFNAASAENFFERTIFSFQWCARWPPQWATKGVFEPLRSLVPNCMVPTHEAIC